MLNLHHIVGHPWAVTAELAEFGQQLLEADGFAALRLVAELHKGLNAEDAQARSEAAERRADTVAIVPVLGLLTHRGSIVNSVASRSTAAVGAQMRQLAADPNVGAIVLEVDSPGGEVAGMPETAALIREARKVKPVVAVANTIAGSGGYWITSQADEVFASPSARLGSVGVYYPHEDKSAATSAAGRKVTLVSAGKYKTEGNPFEPLSDEARSHIQRGVDDAYEMFVRDISRGRSANARSVSPDDVRKGFGEGRMVGARQAVDLGMADKIGTLEDAVRRAGALAGERRRAAATQAQVEASRIRRERG